MTVETRQTRSVPYSLQTAAREAGRNLNIGNSPERSAGTLPQGEREPSVNYKLVALPIPADMTLNLVTKKAGNTKGAHAHLRSATTAFTVVEGDEQTTTTAKGNRGHEIDLNAEQYAEAERVLAPLREFAKAGTKATKAQTEAANAIVAEIAANGGIRLPLNRRGAPTKAGESIGSLFAGIVATPPAEDTEQNA